jgi:hypothetical protein
LTLPSLAQHAARGTRPADVALSSRLRFTLPSGSQFLGGVWRLGDRAASEDEAWRFWAPAGTPRPPGREQWREDIAGFRAVLRLATALETLGSGAEPPVPADIMMLPLADFLFLDNLHYLMHDVAIPQDHGLLVHCQNCRMSFLPVL